MGRRKTLHKILRNNLKGNGKKKNSKSVVKTKRCIFKIGGTIQCLLYSTQKYCYQHRAAAAKVKIKTSKKINNSNNDDDEYIPDE
jgi:hypothetical protein